MQMRCKVALSVSALKVINSLLPLHFILKVRKQTEHIRQMISPDPEPSAQ